MDAHDTSVKLKAVWNQKSSRSSGSLFHPSLRKVNDVTPCNESTATSPTSLLACEAVIWRQHALFTSTQCARGPVHTVTLLAPLDLGVHQTQEAVITERSGLGVPPESCCSGSSCRELLQQPPVSGRVVCQTRGAETTPAGAPLGVHSDGIA